MSDLFVYSEDRLAPLVERGAAWMDTNQPGWHLRIIKGRLDQYDRYQCVWGQLYGDFFVKQESLGWSDEDAFAHGLFIPDVVRDEDEMEQDVDYMPGYAILTRLWTDQISRRKTL